MFFAGPEFRSLKSMHHVWICLLEQTFKEHLTAAVMFLVPSHVVMVNLHSIVTVIGLHAVKLWQNETFSLSQSYEYHHPDSQWERQKQTAMSIVLQRS
jgi:hypothetical protein